MCFDRNNNGIRMIKFWIVISESCVRVRETHFSQYTFIQLDVDFSFVFSGGLSLQGNPWLCTCDNTWLGTWLRRWMRETLQLHASIIGKGGTFGQKSSQFLNY